MCLRVVFSVNVVLRTMIQLGNIQNRNSETPRYEQNRSSPSMRTGAAEMDTPVLTVGVESHELTVLEEGYVLLVLV